LTIVLAGTERFRFLCGLEGVGAMTRGEGCSRMENAMFPLDPWEKAADCDRALRITIDPVHRENLTYIREFWISWPMRGRF